MQYTPATRLFDRLYTQLNDNHLVHDTSVRKQAPASISQFSHRPPAYFQSGAAGFLHELCQFLVEHTDRGNDNDIVHKIARCESPEKLESFVTMETVFFQFIMQGLFNDSKKFSWEDEKERPQEVDALLTIFEKYLRSIPFDFREMALHDPMSMPQKLVWLKNMHELFDDGMEGIKMYKTPGGARLGEEAKALSRDTRAKVIYLGGLDKDCETPEEIRRDVQRIRRIAAPRVKHEDYDSYVITYNNRATLKKLQHIYRYNADPEHFASPAAAHVVEHFLQPVYTDARGGKLTEAALCKQMSLITFVGYSYGGTLIQEIRNALADKLKTVGYQPKAIRKAMACVAAFNLSTVANIVDKSSDGDFTQAFSSADGDKMAEKYSNIGAFTEIDSDPTLKQHRVETGNRIPLIALRGMNVPDSIISFTTKSLNKVMHRDEDTPEMSGMVAAHPEEHLTLPSAGDKIKVVSEAEAETLIEAARHAKKDKHAQRMRRARVSVRVIDESIERPDTMHHHITGNYRTDGVRLKSDHEDSKRELVLRSNPAAEFVLRALRAQIEGSIKVQSGAAIRDSAAINHEIAERWLTSERIQRMSEKSGQIRGLLEREVELGHIKPSPGR